jgi:alkanesulfonate monooxygenase SsuD/methylene tetrahydromethanopterin reductase-like flavin-dependent oxidoreductase (luciferase family)
MKFATYFDSSIPVGLDRDRGDVLRETLHLVELSEEIGLDGAFFPEHHFTVEGYDPVPLTMCALVARTTRRIAIGTNLLLLPLHHPLHVMEQVAIIDQVSGGRLQVGLGLGYREGEFEGFGVDRRNRGSLMEEGLAIIRKYLAGEQFSFMGEHYRLENVAPVLQPLSGPSLPLWVGARGGRAGSRAGRYGCSLILGTSQVPYAEYLAGLREGEHDPSTKSLAATRSVYVSDSDDTAWREAGESVLYESRVAREWYGGAADLEGDKRDPYVSVDQRRRVAKMIGSPDTVARDIVELHSRYTGEVRLDWIFLNPRPACLDLRLTERSMRLFAREVVPRVQKALEAGGSAGGHRSQGEAIE